MIVFKMYADLMKKQFPVVIVYAVILMSLFFVLSNTSQEKTFTGYEQTKVRIAVFDHDRDSEVVEQLLSYLTEYCEYVTIPERWEGKLDALYYRDVYAILTIPSGFTQDLLNNKEAELELNSLTNTQEACYVNQAITAYVDYVKLYYNLYPAMQMKEVLKKVKSIMDTSVQVVNAGNDGVKEETADVNYYYNLLGFVLLTCIIIVVCSAMTEYQKETIYKRHMISPLPLTSMNLQLLLGNVVYTYMYTLLFLALFVAIGGEKSFTIHTLLYWVNTFAYTASILFLAYFLSYRIKNKRLISIIANTVGLILAWISGVFVQQEYLTEKLVKVASITPVYWFVHGNNIIMKLSDNQVAKLLPLAKIIGIQLMFAATFFSLVLVGAKLDETRQ